MTRPFDFAIRDAGSEVDLGAWIQVLARGPWPVASSVRDPRPDMHLTHQIRVGHARPVSTSAGIGPWPRLLRAILMGELCVA